jgi:exodeoxyribonuclease III
MSAALVATTSPTDGTVACRTCSVATELYAGAEIASVSASFHTEAHPVDILKIATFNINGIRSRLPVLLEWLEREGPDVVCLQELKAPDAAFPINDIRGAGYGAIWHGQTSWNGVAILAKGIDPLERRRGLPGGKADTHSRYLEAAAHGVIVGSLYLPNGNPQPGPKFDYKLAWFERLIKYAAGLYDSGHPVVLAGDYNVVPTDEDIYNPRSLARLRARFTSQSRGEAPSDEQLYLLPAGFQFPR